MKKFLLFLLVPFSAFADTCHLEQIGGGDWRIVCEGSGLQIDYVDVTNEVYVIANCENLKSSLLSSVSSIHSSASNIQREEMDIETALYYPQTDRNVSTNQNFIYFLNEYRQSQSIIAPALENIINETNPSGVSGNLYDTIQNINCGSCPTNGASGGGSGGDCCDVDFTQIIDRMIIAEQQRAAISNQIARISNYLEVVTNQLAYNNFLVEHGFGSVTDLLVAGDDLDENVLLLNSYYFLEDTGQPVSDMWSYYKDGITSIADLLRMINYNIAEQLPSLNNYNYNLQYRLFPRFSNQVTNTLVAIHLDQTNYFSFFRGEIGVQGVLEDWQSEQVSGTYHDFLTNHYLAVVRGDSLSGNQSSKTNWFSRIETLLAALVFTDTTETNTVDTSAGNTEREQLATSYGTANQAASTFSEDFKSTSQSIVTLYQNYFTTFENASMPSHVVLMRLSNSDPSEEVEIAFQSDSLGILVESCRVVTTLCWSSVGIFLLYKFLVWSARCVIVACQFIYRAISSVFKS